MVRLLSRCSLLSSLTLQCRDDVSILLAAAAEHCHQLKHLLVRFCPILTYTDLQALAEGCPGLTTLNLEELVNFAFYVLVITVDTVGYNFKLNW